MGYAARLNPRSFDHAPSKRSAYDARLKRFVQFFPDRAAYEAYLTKAHVTDAHRAYLEWFLPEHLKAHGSV